MSQTPRHVALLRGINVGGKRTLPMADLRGIFEDAAARDVRTYIQSGNVVFAAPASAAKRIAAGAGAAIESRFGFEAAIVVRTGAAMIGVAAGHPFGAEGVDERALHVGFLSRAPSARAVAALDPERSAPERFAVEGTEIYFHLPNGVARTRLTSAYLDSTLGVVCTVRNWRTVQRLARMASGEE